MDDLQTTIETSSSVNFDASETDIDRMAAPTGAKGEVDLLIGTSAASQRLGLLGQHHLAVADPAGQHAQQRRRHHVQTADTQRQVEINADVTSTAISETEQTTTRTLEKIDRSRVLNFVFRQLLQELFTSRISTMSRRLLERLRHQPEHRHARLARRLPAFGARRQGTVAAVRNKSTSSCATSPTTPAPE